MKASFVTGISVLTLSFMLVGCSNSSSKSKDSSSKDTKSEKLESSKKESLKKESSKNKASSESLVKAKSESEAKESSTDQSQKSNSSSQSSNAPDFSLDIHSFVNKYGMSEAAYRSEYMGMSSKDALYATPDSHETSGELQAENMYRNGEDPYASNSDSDDEGVPDQDDSYYTQKYWADHPEEAAEAEENNYDGENYSDDDYYYDEDY